MNPGDSAPLRQLDLVATDIELDWFFTPQLSPDGSRIAYIAKNRLIVRALDQLEPRAVADVSSLTPLAWSPDSRMIVYNDGRQLRKVAVDFHAPSWLPNGDLLHVVHWKETGESLGERRLSLAVFDGKTRIPVRRRLGARPRARARHQDYLQRRRRSPS